MAGTRNWVRVRRIAGYGAALAMVPYFVLKIVWTLDGLRGEEPQHGPWRWVDWAMVNGLTVAMAGLAILLGLALSQPWGMRIPAALVLPVAWLGTGFLAPMLPVMPFSLLAKAGDDSEAARQLSAAIPPFELAMVGVSFAGFGLGVAIAVPLYVGQRWPQAFTGRLPEAPAVDRATAGFAAGAGVVIGLPQVYWALGGTLGLDPANLGRRDAAWHLLTGYNALWALIAAGSVWALVRHGGRPVPLLAWLASGFLFAWGTWKATFAFAVRDDFPTPEQPWVLALQNHVGAVAGLAILLVVLQLVTAQESRLSRSQSARRRAEARESQAS